MLQLAIGDRPNASKCRFNNGLLLDNILVNEIKDQIKLFISINDTLEVTRSTLWDTLKAYLRGQIISLTSYRNKQRKERELNITTELLEIDKEYAISPSSKLYKKKVSLQTELKLLYTNDTIRLLTQLQHKYYEHGEKTGSLLARQIKEVAASRLITEIRTSAGQLTTDKKRELMMYFENIIKHFTLQT